jgi:hypothetical protein
MIKDYILRSVDTLPSLIGKTVSEGRLNVNKAIQLLLNRPILTTTPNLLHVEIAPNSTTEEDLLLKNTGNDTLSYKLTIPEDAPWLTLSSDTGMLIPAASDLIVVTFDNNGMDTGLYVTNIHITTDEAGTKDIPVQMHVTNYVLVKETVSGLRHIMVAPNPFNNQTTISFYQEEEGSVKLTLFDIQGKEVYSKKRNFPKGVNKMVWNGDNVKSGIYFYNLKSDRDVGSGKIVKY